MKQWEDCTREDLRGIPMMRLAGWTPVFNSVDKQLERTTPENVPHYPVAFEKGMKTTWRSIYRWRVADLIQGKYENHRTYETLEQVKDNES